MVEIKQQVSKRIPKKITQNYLHNYALFYLGRFSSSVANVRRILLNRARKSIAHHDSPTIEQAKEWIEIELEKLVRTQMLDDKTYVCAMHISLRRKGVSKRNIEAKLAQKGISSSFVQSVIRSIGNDENAEEEELKAAMLYKKRKKLGLNPEKRQKDMASMARAGFSYDIIRKVLDSNIDII